MSKVAIVGDPSGTGTFTISAPNGNTDRTLVLPDEAGTIITTAGVPASAMPAGSVIQVATTTQEGIISTSVQGVPSTITNGAQVFSLSFTPKFSTSIILVTTSTVMVNEETNIADICWLALWDGSTFIAANSGTGKYSNFAGGLNVGYTSLNHTYSAGNTSTRTISVRAGMNGGSGSIYINGNTYSAYTGSSSRIQMVVMEIAG